MHLSRTTAPRLNLLQQFLRNLAGAIAALSSMIITLPGHAAELPAYAIVAKAGRLVPAVLNVPAGVRFKIIIRNEGPGPIEFESLELRKEKVLAEGAHSFVVIAPLRPGTYPFFDEFHPDTSRGHIVAK